MSHYSLSKIAIAKEEASHKTLYYLQRDLFIINTACAEGVG